MSRIDACCSWAQCTEEQKEAKEAETKREPSGGYTDYVVGFLLDRKRKLVVLIEKKKPEWQVGFLNGVGGHIESNETPCEAMEREFKEETGLEVWGWDHAITLTIIKSKERVFFFSADWPKSPVQTTTDERIFIANYDQLPENSLLSVKWAIQLCLDSSLMPPLEFSACSINEDQGKA